MKEKRENIDSSFELPTYHNILVYSIQWVAFMKRIIRKFKCKVWLYYLLFANSPVLALVCEHQVPKRIYRFM